MSVSTPKRLFLCIIAVLTGTSAFANHPSPRTLARMAYDSKNHVGVLFGGHGRPDKALADLVFDSNETWIWTGSGWVQEYPETVPPKRSAHTMLYDSVHERVLMFGGRQEATTTLGPVTFLRDLWAWKDNNWEPVSLDGGPTGRQYPGFGYDPDRDVIVVYGGQEYLPLKPKQKVPDIGSIFDTWELSNDGTWTKTDVDSAKVARPLLEWDPIAHQMVMMGIDGTTAVPVMYRYIDGSWQKQSPSKLPTCTAEGHFMVRNDGHLLFLGGVCPGSGTPSANELFEWDGSTWVARTIGTSGRGIGQAAAYDTFRDRIIIYGGTTIFGSDPFADTAVLTSAGLWRAKEIITSPEPRSWMAFESDPLARGIVLLGGLSEAGGLYSQDTWQLSNGKWGGAPGVDSAPPECTNPVNTLDTDRNKLVVLCSGRTIWEFDGTAWKDFGALNPIPDERRFTGISYDQNLKKVVLFGGFFNNNYRNDTWLWDGAKWTEVDIDNDERPEHRGNFVMWYDPALKKTILYAGIGRPNINSKVTRFSDMWSFDGTRWTKMNVTNTPGVRFRPLIKVNPTTGKLLLFGGLRSETVDEDSIRQFYDNDTWEWDGASSTWTQLNPEHRPPIRQNGGMAWDPTMNEMVVFGGWAEGFSYSDVWAWNGVDWRVLQEPFLGPKRRSVR